MLRTIAKLLLLFSPVLTYAALPTKAVAIQNGYYTGSAYRTLPDDARMTYIAGVIDGYLAAERDSTTTPDLVTCTGHLPCLPAMSGLTR